MVLYGYTDEERDYIMVLNAFSDEEEPDSIIDFEPVYKCDDQDNNDNPYFLFDFDVHYTIAPDGEEDYDYINNLETRHVHHTHEFEKEGLIGGDQNQIEANVYHILGMIQVPSYRDVASALTYHLLGLKKSEAISDSPKIDKIKVIIEVTVSSFPGDMDIDMDVNVKLAVAPASDEAVEKHLETVVVEREECCVICMDTIRVGSDVAVARMPCKHMFHRMCGEKWLRNSGICPVCRFVFPSC